MPDTPKIPFDIFESPQEILILLPLGGVTPESLDVQISDYQLLVTGDRARPDVRPELVAAKTDCYRGPIELRIDLPPKTMFHEIHCRLTRENILEIIVPKTTVPTKIKIEKDSPARAAQI